MQSIRVQVGQRSHELRQSKKWSFKVLGEKADLHPGYVEVSGSAMACSTGCTRMRPAHPTILNFRVRALSTTKICRARRESLEPVCPACILNPCAARGQFSQPVTGSKHIHGRDCNKLT